MCICLETAICFFSDFFGRQDLAFSDEDRLATLAMIRFVQKGNLFVVMLIATYSETDSVNFKDASFVVTLVATYSETDSAKFAKFKDASL